MVTSVAVFATINLKEMGASCLENMAVNPGRKKGHLIMYLAQVNEMSDRPYKQG
jgi:hypothetical protein